MLSALKVLDARADRRSRAGAAALGAAMPARGPALHTRAGVVLMAALLVLMGTGCSKRPIPLEDAPLPFRQAEDNFRLGNYEKAVRGYQVFLDSEASEKFDELIPRAYYRMAMAEYRRGRYTECLAVLDRMERRLPDEQWAQVDALRGDAELARGNPISALRWWEEGWKIADGDEKREARQHISDALDRMDSSALTRARSVLTTGEMRALVDTRLHSTGGPSVSPPTGTTATSTSTGVSSAPVEAAPSRLGDDTGPPPRVAVLLPLSGQYATYGQRSLNGIKLALGA
jgi:tetratricopeptide (TPR) repeat protein